MSSVIAFSKAGGEEPGLAPAPGILHGRILYLLFLPLPIIDSLNGMMNGGANDGFASLGMAYRLCIIACCLFVLFRGVIPKRFLAISIAILLLVVLPHIFDLTEGSFLSLAVKTFLPILCIEAFIREPKNSSQTHHCLCRLVDSWSVLFPAAVLLPLALGAGFQTYGTGTVGFKGFFYAQNDLCFALSVLFFISCGKTFRHLTAPNVLKLVALGLCIVILGMKGGYILLVVSVLYWIMRSEITMLRRFALVVTICVAAVLVGPNVLNLMTGIIHRWSYFSSVSNTFFDFFSSGRLERIPVAIGYLNQTGANLWPLFGAGMTYGQSLAPFGLVEMDPFDLFFQFGLLGALFLTCYYLSFLFVKLPDKYKHYRMALIIAFIMAVLAGHVLNSALSAMVLAVLCGLAWTARSVQTTTSEGLRHEG